MNESLPAVPKTLNLGASHHLAEGGFSEGA